MKLFLFTLYSLFFSIRLCAETPPVILEKGKEKYQIGLYLDILEDKVGNLTISDVSGQKWSKNFKRSTSPSPNLGRSTSTFWARFKVRNLSPSKKWILSNNFTGQDFFDFYQKKKDGWKHTSTGDMVEFTNREFKIRAFHFTLSEKEETLYFIKIKGFSNMFPLTISSSHNFIKENIETNLAFGIFFGLAFMMLIHNLFYYLRLWEPNYIFYVFHVFFYIIFSVLTSGHGYLFPIKNLTWILNEGHILAACLSPLSLNIFASRFLNLREKNPNLYKISLFWSFSFMLLSILMFFVPLFYMRRVHNLTFLLFFLSLIFILSVKVRENYNPAKYFSAAIVSKIIGGLTLVFTLNGFITSNLLTRNASIFGAIIEMALLSLGLSVIQKLKQDEILNTLETKVEERTSELRKTNLDMEKSNENLENSNTALEKIQNERSLFFANLSHELRTPLNAILGFSQILQSIKQNKEQKEYINSINTSGRSLLRLVSSIHDFSKIELNKLKVQKKKFDLKKVLTTTALHFKNEASRNGLYFSLEINNDVPSWIESDELALKQVLDNLLSNALKFTKKGHIKIKVEGGFKEDSDDLFDLFIQVEDTGAGIPSGKLEKLFKPFSQFHEHGSIKERGSGLGLYISKKIIDDMGGDLRVITHVGKGSVFMIHLSDVTYSKEESGTGHFTYNFFGETILIADDLPINIKLYEAYLSQHNLKVEIARDGNELLEKARTIKPDLIMTDFDMPGLKGDQVLEILREEQIKTPVVLVSAIKIEENAKKDFQDFLQKPVSYEDFIKSITGFLKHEANKIVEGKKDHSYEFEIPENLDKKGLELIKEVYEKFKVWRDSMPVSEIELESDSLKDQLNKANIKSLTPLLEKLKENAATFNINLLRTILDYATKKLKKYLP
ncbi:ATP-binding protein [Bacteriovoracales bacterium]|nr:ATP-binding protein [Bacteriovoracales bacterium]